MPRIQDGLAFYLNQSDHAIPNCDFVDRELLDVISQIVLSCIGTQVNDIGKDRQTAMLNRSTSL